MMVIKSAEGRCSINDIPYEQRKKLAEKISKGEQSLAEFVAQEINAYEKNIKNS